MLKVGVGLLVLCGAEGFSFPRSRFRGSFVGPHIVKQFY